MMQHGTGTNLNQSISIPSRHQFSIMPYCPTVRSVFESSDGFIYLLRPWSIYLDMRARSHSISVRGDGREVDGGDGIDIFDEHGILEPPPVARFWGVALGV